MNDSVDLVRARLSLSYDGTDFSGWASQPNLRTVQGTLEAALHQVLRTESALQVTVAGRTDAGVHARGQVAHVDVPRAAWETLPGRSSRTEPEALLSRLNGVLPDDVIVTAADEAPVGFDARFSAMERRYAYRIADSLEFHDPLRRHHVLFHPRTLDVDALNAASAMLYGLRDFAAYCRPREGATTIRELKEFSWERKTTGLDAGLVVATVRADAFCHSMVRSLVGAAIPVGEGRRDVAWFADVAASTTRTSSVAVAPARGLTLEEVHYPDSAELGARAERIRARRTLE